MNYHKRGEIATVVALSTLLIMGVSSFIASNFLKQKFPFSPRAEQSNVWDWDVAAKPCSKNSDEAGCICTNLKSGGFCSQVGSTKSDGSVCIANKWDNKWGCWGSLSSGNTSVNATNSCSLVQSKYGTCPDWATENSCHQRLLANDPDDQKWFKCVSKWWNGPCDTKETCEGKEQITSTPVSPSDTSYSSAPVGPVNRTGLTSCYNYTSQTNCTANCQLYAEKRKEPDFDKWYCNKNLAGDSSESGKYCCPPNLNSSETTSGTYAKEGEACYNGKPCESNKGLVCGNITGTGTFMSGTCIKTSGSLNPTISIPAPTGGISSGAIRNKCFAETSEIKTYGITFKEPNPGTIVECGDDILLDRKIQNSEHTISVYRICRGDQPEDQNLPCHYSCYDNNKQKECFNVSDQHEGHVIRILNTTNKSVFLSSVLIKKELVTYIFSQSKGISLNDYELLPGTTYVINFQDDNKVSCKLNLPTTSVIATLFYKNTLSDTANLSLTSDSDWCWDGVKLLIEIK